MTPRRHLPLVTTLAAALVFGAMAWRTSIGEGRSGQDYGLILWAPWHGLLAGYNPYEASAGYLSSFHVSLAATLHAPGVLLLAAPLSMSDQVTGFHAVTAANVALVWAAAMIVVQPTTWRRAAAAMALGLLLTFTGPGFFALRLGQVTPLVLLGLALVVRWPRSWAAVAGVALLTVDPPFALPMSILLLGLGYRRAVVGGILVSAILSAPIVVWAAVNAGGLGNLARSMVDSLRTSDSAVAAATRVDLVGAYGDDHAPLTLAACAATIAGAVWLHRRRVWMSPVVAITGTAWCLATFYAQPYSLDLLFLVAVPLLLMRPWRALELWALATLVVGTAMSWPAMELSATVLGGGIDRPWNLGTIVSGFLLVAVVIAGVRRIAGTATWPDQTLKRNSTTSPSAMT